MIDLDMFLFNIKCKRPKEDSDKYTATIENSVETL